MLASIKLNSLLPYLFKGDESRGVGGAHAGAAVTHRSIGDGELSQVHADHLAGDHHDVEHLSVVHSDLAANHLGDDQSISEVSLDGLGAIQARTWPWRP